MRLFTAVNFDTETRERLLEVQDALKAQSFSGNFTRPENFHLTLVFIGEVQDDMAGEIASIVKGIPDIEPFSINFNRLGCFKRGGKELWWIGADPQE